MKTLLLIILGSVLISMTAQAKKVNPIPSEVTLTHRILNHCENSSCYYDLFYMNQVYGYGLSIGFGNDHGENKINTVQVVDQFAKIIDLGEKSCNDIENEYEGKGQGYPTKQMRKENPMGWLTYSSAWDKLGREPQSSTIRAQAGHCYLMYKSSSDQRIIVAFHVKELKENVFIRINEIEVFQRGIILDSNSL